MRAGNLGVTTLLGLLVLLVGAGCQRVGEPPHDPHQDSEGSGSEVEHVSAGQEAEGQHDELGEEGQVHSERTGPLMYVVSALVEDRLGPGGTPFEVARRTSERVGHQRTIGRTTYSIALRSENLTYYPCSSCHVAGRPAIHDERVVDVHQDIQPVHPAENNAVCSACHVTDNPEWLTLAGLDPVPLNEAYRLCAQCHFIQVAAWSGGAHGKRLDTWRGPRVVMNCTDCHNPHDPGIPTRIPFPGPRIPRTGPKQP